MHDEPFWVNFYQLRFFEELVQDLREVCPHAWYFQVANPVFAGMTYLGERIRTSRWWVCAMDLPGFTGLPRCWGSIRKD